MPSNSSRVRACVWRLLSPPPPSLTATTERTPINVISGVLKSERITSAPVSYYPTDRQTTKTASACRPPCVLVCVVFIMLGRVLLLFSFAHLYRRRRRRHGAASTESCMRARPFDTHIQFHEMLSRMRPTSQHIEYNHRILCKAATAAAAPATRSRVHI